MTRRSPRSRGFTLAELMISLVMGLIIALAVVALARAATTSFHDQARISGVEMAVRAASERFRADVAKISYMSTANIKLDPRIAKIPGAPTGSRFPALNDLQGLRVAVGAGETPTQGALALATNNRLKPDDVFISGNLTSDDSYRGQWVDTGSCGGGGARIRLSALADPSVARLFNGATTQLDIERNARAVFMPGANMTPPVGLPASGYAVQVMDIRGCYHYVTVCAVISPDVNTVFVDLAGDGTNSILTPENTGGDVCGGRMMEEVAIAPVHRVRWYLAPGNPADLRLYDPAVDQVGAPNKFNLYRQLLAADGLTPVGPPEIIAEYAIDLKVGVVVDDDPRTPPPNNIQVWELDSDPGGAEISKWTATASTTVPGLEGPQRIRGVRYRISVRSNPPNITGDLPPILPASPWLFRYCMENAPPATCKKWARVRNIVSEVGLINQARLFY